MSTITELPGFRLEVLGTPRGKGRPRFVRATGRTYTDAQTRTAEQRIQGEWDARGRPFLHGALDLQLTVYVARPGSHYRVGGKLSKAGVRNWYPVRTPDLDNALKLVQDALNGLAFKDDKQIVRAEVERRWTYFGQPERMVIGVVAREPQPDTDEEAA